jgi:hypothetical protein
MPPRFVAVYLFDFRVGNFCSGYRANNIHFPASFAPEGPSEFRAAKIPTTSPRLNLVAKENHAAALQDVYPTIAPILPSFDVIRKSSFHCGRPSQRLMHGGRNCNVWRGQQLFPILAAFSLAEISPRH